MNSRFGLKCCITAFLFIAGLNICHAVYGQATMGILPVNIAAECNTILNAQQWQSLSSGLHDYLVKQISDPKITTGKLTREHILLLLKEVPSPDPENLDAESYQIICKKEKLHYLLKFSVESLQIADRTISTQVRVIILDGNNGKIFWEKPIKKSSHVSAHEITGQILLAEVFEPIADELFKEIKSLNY